MPAHLRSMLVKIICGPKVWVEIVLDKVFSSFDKDKSYVTFPTETKM